MEDHEIVLLFLARDEAALEKTQEKYGRRIRALTYELTQDHSAAEECENDTYLQAWNRIPPNEPYTYFYPFLARISRHIALNYCRDRNRLKRKASIESLNSELQESIPDRYQIEDHIADLEFQNILQQFLEELSSEKRRIFIRRYWYLDSIRTISEGFGISPSKVKVILYRCRQQLKKMLKGEGYQ